MDRQEAGRVAAACGLTRLEPKHVDQFATGAEAMKDLAARLPKDLHWTEENALVLSLVGKGGRR